jgi:hypothetical protein
MKHRLSDWATIAEIISAIAIVVSLIFVGLEIRQNTNATYAASYDNLLADIVDWRIAAATNPELARIVNEQNGAESLIWEAALQNFERAYVSRVYGRLGDREWARFEQNLCFQKSSAEMHNIEGNIFSPEFWDFLQSQNS